MMIINSIQFSFKAVCGYVQWLYHVTYKCVCVCVCVCVLLRYKSS